MIPASYMFKQVYHQAWEADERPVRRHPVEHAIPPIQPRKGKHRLATIWQHGLNLYSGHIQAHGH